MASQAQDAQPADGDGTVAVLDAYVHELRRGGTPDKDSILARYPELAPILDCLDDLDVLARNATTITGAPGEGAGAEGAAPGAPAGGSSGFSLRLPDPHSQFGDYELLGTLGRGGMGVVYKARQTSLKRLVAIKMILASQLAGEQEIHRFHTEAQAAAGLRHPHILQIYEAGQLLGQHYFAMQYVDGPDLAQLLKKGPLSAEESAQYALAVARAVAYLHEHGIVHRDLKPSNILLDDQRCPYVTDFGLVKMLETGGNATSTGMIVGTPSYMAPEQAAGRNREVGPLSDVYSLGAILYEMLTGRPPFSEPTPFDTLVQVLEGEPELPRALNPRVPRALELICLKALAKSPERRYQSAAEFADDLRCFLCGEPVRARPQDLRQRLVRWARQEPGLVTRLGVLAVGSLVAQAYYQVFHPVSLLEHSAIMGTLALWALASVACQALIRQGLWPGQVRVGWLATDAVLLTTALVLDSAFRSPLVLIYAVYIVASGLWFQVGLVWFTTAMALAGYGVLLLVGLLRDELGVSPQHHLIVLAALVVVGLMVASQIRRVRSLSRYYEHRPMP
jgi:tRNA A-37 threonylcarbamoyl transferase component Bud32